MSDVILDLGQKLKGALEALFASDQQNAAVLALCNKGRKLPVPKLQRRVISEALGFSHLSNWVSESAKGLLPGAFLDLSAILGFAPTEAALKAFDESFTLAQRIPPFPKRVYQMLDAWCDDSAACLCWTAFVGTPSRLQELDLPFDPHRRGTKPDRFLEIYNENLEQLEPRLFLTVHTKVDPPPLAEYRLRKNPLLFHSLEELKLAATPFPEALNVVPINGTLTELPNTALPASWLDRTTDLPLLDDGLPAVGDSEAEIEAKAMLYGGRSDRGRGVRRRAHCSARDFRAGDATADARNRPAPRAGLLLRHPHP